MKKIIYLGFIVTSVFSTLLNANNCWPVITVSRPPGGITTDPIDYILTIRQGSFNSNSPKNNEVGSVAAAQSYDYPIYLNDNDIDDGIVSIIAHSSWSEFHIPFKFNAHKCRFIINNQVVEDNNFKTTIINNGSHLLVKTGFQIYPLK